jgi:heme/copper-type cytochrome/quinol oxidase subunit 4
MESQKFSPEALDAMNKSNIVHSYILQFVFTLITFTVLAFVISMADVRSSTDGAFLGLLAWLGFIVPTSLSSLLWKKETFTLVLIDSINYLLILTIGGAIIGAWK